MVYDQNYFNCSTLGIPIKLVNLALEALSKDSHRQFFGNSNAWQADISGNELWASVEFIFKELKLSISYNMSLEDFSSLIKTSVKS
jgi:hypothetical protein